MVITSLTLPLPGRFLSARMDHLPPSRDPFLVRLSIEAARYLFLGALIFAPWVYGSTPAWASNALEGILSIVLFLWLAGCLSRHLLPHVHPWLLAGSLFLLVWGWWMAFNPHFKVDSHDNFTAITSRFSWLPGSVDGPTSYHNLLRVICLLGAACFVCDTSARRVWRRRIWRVMAAVGVSLVLFGLVQSAFARPLFIWNREDMTVPFFATYYYHGNAGSFINLVLPPIAGLAALVLRRPNAHVARSIWIPGFFICVAGAFVNVSRSAIVVTVLLCIAMLIWQFRERGDNELLPPRKVRLVYGLVMIAAVLCLAGFSGWERPAEKFAMLPGQLNAENKRFVSTQICIKMLHFAGWHGFGPGTFPLVFPHYTGDQGKLIPGIWLHAHDDYLQSLLEWGWPASGVWGVLFFGGMAKLFIQWRKRRDLSISDRVLAFTSGLALAGLAIHAFMDFPMQIASLQLYAAVYVGFGWGCASWEGVVTPA